MDGRRMPRVHWHFGEGRACQRARRLAARSEGEGGERLEAWG